MKRLLFPLAIYGLASSPIAFADEVNETPKNLSKLITNFTPAMPLDEGRIQPKYPYDMAARGKEGWARVSFVVNKEGKVEHVTVVEHSGEKAFAKAAKSAIKKWKYKPATENGEKVDSCQNLVQMDFKMDDGGVSSSFLNEYKKATQALSESDTTLAKQHIDVLVGKEKKRYSEQHYLNLLLLQYGAQVNDQALLTKAALDTDHNKKGVPKPYAMFILNEKLTHATAESKLDKALRYIDEMSQLTDDEARLNGINKAETKILALIESDKIIGVKGETNNNSTWWHTPVRNQFSIIENTHDIHKLDIRCENNWSTYSFTKESSWKIPSSWHGCQVLVYTEPNATFTFVEHPYSNPETQAKVSN
ncbi:energy transducer TonB [Thalassotalea agarivorans]|uniref:TonB family C-terminal domain-containing protein n=1 Tax=Thalassotalea agarivorans TaxID=349064 RepID=A0A1I0EJM6_THASX|nr:TonB family protein [Thalassotalea agarivorans]SET45366.1 TonB family C-terminal domain-containing protein [Thalassotalea agarivorans]